MAGNTRNPLLQEKCQFCGSAENNELSLGAKKRLEDVVTHYYCLLLSSKMEQNGEDTDGLLGFMLPDIRRELTRGKRLNCIYCKKMGATIECKYGKCTKRFHLPCGIKHGSLHQFFGHFRSFCPEHRPSQKIPPKLLKEMADGPPTCCAICYEDVPQRPSRDTVWAPCCKKGAWFHRECTQKLANSAGYFFKCPLCNNKEEFGKAMQECGIYIPEQDASWETVPNAYEELLHRHDQCDHPKCRDPKGRSNDEKRTCWELVLCDLCGSQGVHIKCGALNWSNPEWECVGCKSMLKEAGERRAADESNANIDVDSEPPATPSSTPSPAPPPSPVASSSKVPFPTPHSFGDVNPLLSKALGSPPTSGARSLRSRDVAAMSSDVGSISSDVKAMPMPGNLTVPARDPTMMLAMETAQARNARPPAALRGQKARRGLNRCGVNFGGRIKQDLDDVDVRPAGPLVDNAEVIDLLTDSDDDIVIIDDDLPPPPAVTELVTNDGSKIQVVQVVAEESLPEVALGDVKVGGSLLTIFKKRQALTVTSVPIEDDVVIIDSDSVTTPIESKYSVGVMKSNGGPVRQRMIAQRGGRQLGTARSIVAGTSAKSVLKVNPETTIEPIAPEPMPQSANTPRRRPSQVLQNVAKRQGGDSPQRLVPYSSARQVSHSSKPNTAYANTQPAQRSAPPMSNAQFQTPVPNAPQNTAYNQQFANKNYMLTSDQYKTNESYQYNALPSAAPNNSYSYVGNPSQSPKRPRMGPVRDRDHNGKFRPNPPNRNAYDDFERANDNFDRANDGLRTFPPSYDESMNSVPNAVPNMLGYQSVDRGYVPPRQNVMYGPVGGYVAAADSAANVMLQPGQTYVTMSGSPQQFQGFMVTSQSTVIPANYVMNAPTGQQTSVGGASSQYDCCFQRAHADGPATPTATTPTTTTAATSAATAAAAAANGNTVSAKDSAASGSSASAVSVAGVAEQGHDESSAATADEAPGSPTEPRSIRNRLIDFKNFTFKVNGPNCINVVCNSSVTHIRLTRPKKSKLIPVLPTVPLVPAILAVPAIKQEVVKRGRGRPSTDLASRPHRNRVRGKWSSGKDLTRSRRNNKSFTVNEDLMKNERDMNESLMTSAETSAAVSAAKSAATSSTNEAQSTKSTKRASLSSSQSSSRSAKHNRYVYVPLPDPKHLLSSKYSLSEKTAFNTRSKTVQANSRSTRSKVSLKQFNFLEGSDKYVPIFKHADVHVSKPCTPVKVARADLDTSESKTNGKNEEKPSVSDLGNYRYRGSNHKGAAERSPSTTSSGVFEIQSSPDKKCSWANDSDAGNMSDATVAVDKKLVCKTPAKRKRLNISDFVLTSTEKRNRDEIDVGDSDAETEETSYTAVTMRPSPHFTDAVLKAESSSCSVSSASTVPVSSDDRRQEVPATDARPRLRGKHRQTSTPPSVLSGDSERADLDKIVRKKLEDSDYSDYNFEDGNEEDEDDEEYIKKTIMQYSKIDKMSTMKAKSLTARKFLPSSRTEELQRERIKVMKRLALR